MANKQPIELFMPPNMLKAKVGGGAFSGLDLAAMKRADVAMEELKGEFSGWAAEDVARLVAARAGFVGVRDVQARDALLRAAHDLKGQAATFDFPLVARIAASLTRLIGEIAGPDALPLQLVDAHVSAIQVIHRNNANAADPTVGMLIAELEARVSETVPRKMN
jgi:chemotaxis protein histidine kinase CheA